MDVPNLAQPSSTILVIEPDIHLAEDILRVLTDAAHETYWLPPGSDADVLDLLAAVDFDGLYCSVELSRSFKAWEIGTIFNFYRPECPAVYATSSGQAPPCLRRRDLLLRKPFAMERLLQAFAPMGYCPDRDYKAKDALGRHAPPLPGAGRLPLLRRETPAVDTPSSDELPQENQPRKKDRLNRDQVERWHRIQQITLSQQ